MLCKVIGIRPIQKHNKQTSFTMWSPLLNMTLLESSIIMCHIDMSATM